MKTDYTNNWKQMEPVTLGAAAIAAGGAVLGQGIQMGATKLNNTKSYERTQKLMDKQYGQNQQMALFNQKQQMEMWEKTGPVGQMEQYKKAGLNPALMYGDAMGAGGSTAAAQGAPVGQSGNKGDNPGAGAGVMGLQMGAQLALIKAQKENIEADTANKMAQGGKATAETENVPATGEKIKAETENIKQSTLASQVQTDIQKLQLEKNNATFNDEIQLIMRMRQQAGQTLERQVRENKVDEATKNTRIKQVDADYAATLVGNELTRQKIGESQSNVRLNDEQVMRIQNDVKNSLRQMEINWTDLGNRSELIKQQIKALGNAIQMNDTPASTKAIQDLGKILSGAGIMGSKTPTQHYHETINYNE